MNKNIFVVVETSEEGNAEPWRVYFHTIEAATTCVAEQHTEKWIQAKMPGEAPELETSMEDDLLFLRLPYDENGHETEWPSWCIREAVSYED